MTQTILLVVNIDIEGLQDGGDGSWTLTPKYSVGSILPMTVSHSPNDRLVTEKGDINLKLIEGAGDNATNILLAFKINSTKMTDRNGKSGRIEFSAHQKENVFVPSNPNISNAFLNLEAFPIFQAILNAVNLGKRDYLMFADLKNDGQEYEYCLKVTCYEAGASAGWEADLDPRVENRGGGG